MVGTRFLVGDIEPIYDMYGDVAHNRAWGGKNSELKGSPLDGCLQRTRRHAN